MFPSPFIFHAFSLDHRPLQFGCRVNRLGQLASPIKGIEDVGGKGVLEFLPHDFVDLFVHLPSLFQALSVFDGGAFAGSYNSKLLGRFRLPYPYVAVVRTRKYEPGVIREGHR